MKIMFYALRPFDEQAYCEPYSKQYGIDYAYTAAVPTPDNLELAKGCDAVSTNPCLIAPEYLEAWAAMGVKFLPCRSIGYDHIPQQKAKELGMRISHSWYPPAGVADYAIMLMLMCNRKVGQILRRADAQDYSLNGKMGRDITRMTVGVIGTGNIGRTVLRHLSGFGCKLLAYDLSPNDEARILRALHIACADDFTAALEQGLDTPIGERGAGLSEGQLQRIAIARAIFADRPVLLLDDVLSELDQGRQDFILNEIRSGQVFITCCETEKVTTAGQIFHIQSGSLKDTTVGKT